MERCADGRRKRGLEITGLDSVSVSESCKEALGLWLMSAAQKTGQVGPLRVDNLSPTALIISTHRSGSGIKPPLIQPGPISWSDPEHLVKAPWPGRLDQVKETGRGNYRQTCRVTTGIAVK